LQVGYVMQVTGQQLAADLLDCLPDYQLAFDGSCADGYSAYYQCERTRQLNSQFGDIMYHIQDLEVWVCVWGLGGLTGGERRDTAAGCCHVHAPTHGSW
jgi:hypothetical protein